MRRGRRYVSLGEVPETLAGKTERTARRIYTTIHELDAGDRSGPGPISQLAASARFRRRAYIGSSVGWLTFALLRPTVPGWTAADS